MRKVLNDEFSVTLTNFTDLNDQFSYFVKTLNIPKGLFIPRKKCFIYSRNHIKLDKTAKSKLRKKSKDYGNSTSKQRTPKLTLTLRELVVN